MLFIKFPFRSDLRMLDYGENPVNLHLIKRHVESFLGTDQFTLLCNGKSLHDVDIIPDDSNIQVIFSLPGGKGGFGSMLRAIGAQIEKTTNREACRDLSGRRLRDINEEQRLKKWISKEAEREADKIRRRKERIERLKNKAPHKFFDFEYEKEISELPDRINDALSEGLQKAKQPAKRPLEKSEKPVKKTWMADDSPVSSSDSEGDETSSADGASPSKKQKLVIRIFSSSCDADVSESSQSLPSSSKKSHFVSDENSASCDSKIALIERKREELQSAPSSSKESSFVNDESSASCDSRSLPSSSKDSSFVFGESSAFRDFKTASTKRKCVMSDDVHMQDEHSSDIGPKSDEDTNISYISDSKIPDSAESADDINMKDVSTPDVEVPQSVKSKIENDLKSVTDVGTSYGKDIRTNVGDSRNVQDSKEKDDAPVDLLDFHNASELETLGLDRLKSALIARGLKCGGTLSDRAQRLWKIRGLQPQKYPANLLAKSKK